MNCSHLLHLDCFRVADFWKTWWLLNCSRKLPSSPPSLHPPSTEFHSPLSKCPSVFLILNHFKKSGKWKKFGISFLVWKIGCIKRFSSMRLQTDELCDFSTRFTRRELTYREGYKRERHCATVTVRHQVRGLCNREKPATYLSVLTQTQAHYRHRICKTSHQHTPPPIHSRHTRIMLVL